MMYFSVYGANAYWVNTEDKSLGVKLYTRDGKEYPKFSCYGLGVKSDTTLKKLSELDIGQKYLNYTRIK